MAEQVNGMKIANLPENTTMNDTDVMIVETAAPKTGKITFLNLCKAIVAKLASITTDKLETTAKTIVGAINELNSTTQMLRVGTYTELLTCQAKTWRGYTFKNLPEHTFSFPIIAGVGDNGQLEGCQVIRDFSEVGKILVYSPIAQNVNVMLVVMN